jgi:hypothetical protein
VENARLHDLNGRELATALPFVVMVLVMGVLPGYFLDRLQTSTHRVRGPAQVGLDVQQRDEDTRVTVLQLPSLRAGRRRARRRLPPGARPQCSLCPR